jgi:hypothetical protein
MYGTMFAVVHVQVPSGRLVKQESEKFRIPAFLHMDIGEATHPLFVRAVF